MTVEQKIKKIVDSMEGVSYLFDNWQTANIRLDKIKLPAVLNLLPVSGTFNLGRQQLRDCPNCMMAFMDKTKFDFDGTENDAVIEGCKNKAKEFILLLNRSGMFKEISGDKHGTENQTGPRWLQEASLLPHRCCRRPQPA